MPFLGSNSTVFDPKQESRNIHLCSSLQINLHSSSYNFMLCFGRGLVPANLFRFILFFLSVCVGAVSKLLTLKKDYLQYYGFHSLLPLSFVLVINRIKETTTSHVFRICQNFNGFPHRFPQLLTRKILKDRASLQNIAPEGT